MKLQECAAFRTRIRGLWIFAALLLCVVAAAPSAFAQQGKVDSSELSRQNFDRVAASANDIRTLLSNDSGLMVALKRWIAKDASDHGQFVSDTDLTDDAIFDRLQADVPFRAVATRLAQRYGYFLPRLNPSSDAAKEKELLIQERSKLLAQHQVAELTQANERPTRKNSDDTDQMLAGCTVDPAQVCDLQKSGSNSRQREDLGDASPSNQSLSPQPSAPPQNAPPLLRAQATDSDTDGPLYQSQFTDLYGPRVPFTNISLNRGDSANSQSDSTLASRSADGIPSRAIPGMKPQGDGLLAAFGPSLGGTFSTDVGEVPARDGAMASTGIGNAADSSPSNRARPRPQPPEIIRTANPYYGVPSLYDMYVQAVPHPEEPRRFGTEVFENGIRDAKSFPMDLPAGPDYVVGPGDGLSVDLWGGVSQRFYRVIDREGRVSLPEVGPVLVSGKTLAAIQQDLQKILRTQFRDVSADVSLARLRTIRVYEVGDVAKPGAYDISSLSTPLNALFVAGGPTAGGSLRILNHYRGSQLIQTVDVYDLLLHGMKTTLLRLENGDSVQVPPIGPRVTVEGMVRRPAVYELKDEKSLAEVLELAGGILPAATLRHVEVQRLEAHVKETMLGVDITETDAAGETARKLGSFAIQDGDRIRIFPIAPYNEDAIYLEGHVVRPGRYSYRPGLRVTDVIASYKDLLPEPAAQYAEIIRLHAPDFHPVVESFDLAAALNDPAEAPALQAMDTVRIFSRFDFENPPTVSVLGEVRSPGTFRTSGVVHLSDAVHLAGGLAPEAETSDAQIFRYLSDGKFKIFGVSLSRALAGDPAENILLEARDRVLVHRNPDAVEPASVYVQGEIGKPGRYPLTTNMHVADLIRVGGGLQPGADPEVADLTRYTWTNSSKVSGEHEAVALPAVLAGDERTNVALRNGDVLTIRELPGWEDLGSSIALKGEVKHAGTYGIRPGERLSSVLERAGGFTPDAYPFGAILQRVQVREMEMKSRDEIILRVKDAQDNVQLLPDTDQKQKIAKEVALEQWQSTMALLMANPPQGRVTIRISSPVNRWKNSAADIEVRAGDVLVIPKRPSAVMVTGQVFSPTAVSYRPGKSAKWYLSQAGGPTMLANKKAIFVIRADGSVLGAKTGLWSGESLSAALQPGDTVVVPEKAIGGGPQWTNLLLTAQVASTIASTVFIALHY
ncbi:MAG TPA: SLBB domain-containing protein [Verrucomicrobiae bacterium]|nr:SLBB domain-containing protein [Verrucomicrobiae bacterium]